MNLDAARSRLAIFTFAEGIFSALAHDLELVAGDVTGEASESSAELHIPVASLRVRGVVKRGKTVTNVLSSGDRATIEAQIRDSVLPIAEIVASGTLEGARAAIIVKGPRATAHVTSGVTVTRETSEAHVKARVEVSLAALGCAPVKGPMGAFRVSDRVRVEIDLVFT